MEFVEILCENEFCIYQQSGKCVLTSLEHDNVGNCTSCVLINLTQPELDKKKLELIADIETRLA